MTNLTNLRNLFTQYDIAGYIVPSTDEYQGEYTADYAKRLAYISGFTGSNGLAVIFAEKAVLLTDGRYITQAKKQLNTQDFEIAELGNNSWLITDDAMAKQTLGFDPKLFTANQLKLFKDFDLKPIANNLVDEIWSDQPARPASLAYLYDLAYAGQTVDAKLAIVKNKLQQQQAKHYLVTTSDVICWLLNIRAADIAYLPVLQGYLLINHDGKPVLFTNLKRLSNIKILIETIDFAELIEFEDVISKLQGKILLDEQNSALYFTDLFKAYNKPYAHVTDLCLFEKASKNPVELSHIINGHIRDAVALCEFFTWLDTALSQQQYIDEYLLAQKLVEFRAEQLNFIMPSFASICGYADNGAIIHYQATQDSAKQIPNVQNPNGLLLIDSGGQYLGCTTDVTRTITVGEPTAEQRCRYTEVLKGHIRLSNVSFPKGLTGANLDILARYDLWQVQLDYGHGTGHGVGAFLSVHEGPQRIAINSNIALQANMIISIEPGYYKVDEYGIRIENLVYVTAIADSKFLKFTNLTLVPYCKQLIDTSLLDDMDKKYLTDYYNEIKRKIVPLLSKQAQTWLADQLDWLA